MDVECIVHCNGFKFPDETDGNKILSVKSDTGYNNVKIAIKQWKDGKRQVYGEVSVDGPTLIKAIHNAMNT